MAFSFIQYVGDGATTNFAVPFPYLAAADITVKVNGVTTAFTWSGLTTVVVSPAPAVAAVVEVRRTTAKSSANVVFQDGSILGKIDLNASVTQLLYIAQEAFDASANALALSAVGVWDALTKRITNVADPTAAQDAATKNYVDTRAQVAGNVVAPGAGSVGYWLKATGAAAWAWAQITRADISDAGTFGRTLMAETTAAQTRTDLGLATGATTTVGTAATLNAGTGANNVVQLDGTSKLPAVDGSQLTNLPLGRGALVNRSTAGSNVFANGVATAAPWEAANYDTSTCWSAGQPTRLTVPSGVTKVRLSTSVLISANATADSFLDIRKNGAAMLGIGQSVLKSGGNSFTPVSTPVLTVTAGDYFEVYVTQTSGAAANFSTLFNYSWFAMEIVK